MKLKELIPFKYKIKEGTTKRPGILMSVEGTFQRADTKNANGRKYPLDLWKDLLTREDVSSRLTNRQMVGMLGHPADGQTDPEKISHVITRQELRSDGVIYGEADILDTPAGRITATMFEAGVQLGISSRGDGSIEKKGDEDIVQQDFRLETYDFVLKPSTPGAYPMVVENIQENEKLVAEAIAGLVKTEMSEKQRLPILVECLQILSALEANHSDLIQSLSRKITEEVRPSRVVVSLLANESTQPSQEPTMGIQGGLPNGNPQNQLDPATLAWHQGQLQAVARQVAIKAEQEIRSLKDQLLKEQRTSGATQRKLVAAESLIEEFTTKVKTLEGQRGQVGDAKLKRRYEAAVDLLDEALKKLPEVGHFKRRAQALEGLLQAAIEKTKGDKVSTAVKESIAKLPATLQESSKPTFALCRTVEQVEAAFRSLMYAAGKTVPAAQRRQAEPLPKGGSQRGGRVQEQVVTQPVKPVAQASANFQSRLTNRLLKAVQ